MCKYLMLSAVLVLGTAVTTICAGVGLNRLMTFTAGSSRAARPLDETKTVLLRLENTDVDGAAEVLRQYTSRRDQIGVNRREQLVRITGTPWKVNQLKRVLYEIDGPRLPVGPIREAGR